MRVGLITVTSKYYTPDSLKEVFTQISGEPTQHFSHMFLWSGGKLTDLKDSITIPLREALNLMKETRPLYLFILTDYRGLWSQIQIEPRKSAELFSLIVASTKPADLTLMEIDTRDVFKFKLVDEAPLNYLSQLVKELTEIDEEWSRPAINYYMRKWCNYLIYQGKGESAQINLLNMWTDFVETWLTEKIFLDTKGEDRQLTVAEKTRNNIISLVELLKLQEKPIPPKSIIDTSQVSQIIEETLRDRYECITKTKEIIEENSEQYGTVFV